MFITLVPVRLTWQNAVTTWKFRTVTKFCEVLGEKESRKVHIPLTVPRSLLAPHGASLQAQEHSCAALRPVCACARLRRPGSPTGVAGRSVAWHSLTWAERASPAAAMDVGAADFARCLPCLQDRVGRAAFLGERCALGCGGRLCCVAAASPAAFGPAPGRGAAPLKLHSLAVCKWRNAPRGAPAALSPQRPCGRQEGRGCCSHILWV